MLNIPHHGSTVCIKACLLYICSINETSGVRAGIITCYLSIQHLSLSLFIFIQLIFIFNVLGLGLAYAASTGATHRRIYSLS